MVYRYSYITHSSFTPAVGWHFFKFRAEACENEFQHCEVSSVEVAPSCNLYRSIDGQGNVMLWGSISYDHETMTIRSEGIVRQTAPYAIHELPAPYYLTPTQLTACNPKMCELAKTLNDAKEIMHAVHALLTYTPCHTSTTTTAADVFADPRGVCQDYAHLMIALCRSKGLYARYVNGFIAGEGQTHAWVEVSDGNTWYGYDPTSDTCIEWGYVKIAHGRDADDCPTNRGRIYGWTSERQEVNCKLTEITDN